MPGGVAGAPPSRRPPMPMDSGLTPWPPTPEIRLKPRFVSEPPDFLSAVRQEGVSEKSGFWRRTD